MSVKDNAAQSNLKFKITVKGIRNDSEAKSCKNLGKVTVNSGQRDRDTDGGNVLAKPSSKRSAETSLDDDQRGKRRKMDGNLKLLCGKILKELINHPAGWIFSEPVDPVKLKIPDYFSIVAQPMDLGTIKRKLEDNKYYGAEEFAADVRLTFSNAMLYNSPGHEVHYWAKRLDANFSMRWKLLEAKLKHGNKTVEEASFVDHMEKNGQDVKFIGLEKAPLCVKLGTCKSMSFEEKQKLRLELMQILSRKMMGKLRTVFQKFGLIGLNKESLDSYIKSTDDETLRKLRREIKVLLDARDGKIEPARTAQNECPSLRKTDRKELNQSAGASAKHRQSIGSTQASTSDISSERSSEHDHSHSGDSRLDCEVKCSSAFRTSSFSQDSDGPGVVLNEEHSHHPSTPVATCAFIEGQLSPKKALRAAMLKSRFADTIFKATHKVLLDQSDESDRLRMQKERERLEREQLKEKARIQAEIKAAQTREQDDLKMRRERERAALEKMQRTVDIYENVSILKDLEMLYYASLSAPLEQLGLYMKYDNLEEDIEDASLCAEEGEIL